ncbi:GMC oxidoreductase [Nocardia vaccinii]|uniref:GMC oxidoreductase n=1 Tax=Nocardia vaccinii TaxID=1822 RepID=UPI000A06FD75
MTVFNDSAKSRSVSASCAIDFDYTSTAVDNEYRVHGIDGIRLADASVLPAIPAGNTYLTCVMVAERVADFICRPGFRLTERSVVPKMNRTQNVTEVTPLTNQYSSAHPAPWRKAKCPLPVARTSSRRTYSR